MASDLILNYYLALLSVQMALLGLVVAGLVALIEMLHKARPRRVLRLLIPRRALYGYLLFLSTTLLVLCIAVWSIAFGVERTTAIFNSGSAGASLLALCLLGYFGFIYLVYRTRRLLDGEQYIAAYIPTVSVARMRDYLFRWYSVRPDESPLDLKKRSGARQKAVAAWNRRFARSKDVADPFQPIREYLKDNAFNSYDYGTAAGLRFFGQLFDRVFAQIDKNPAEDEYYHLAKYFAESCEEFFVIFRKTAAEKRQADTIRLVIAKGHMFLKARECEGLLTIIRSLEHLAKTTEDEDNIILCIEGTRELTDAYLQFNKNAQWEKVTVIFDQSCLAVTRLAESYYLQRENPLRTVPIISHHTGEYRSVTVSLAAFFGAYDNLGDRYPDVYPQLYFEALEALIESLFARYAEIVQAGHAATARNTMYRHLISWLYAIYLKFGIDAIEHNKPELLALCLANIRRIIRPAKEFKLNDERADLTVAVVELVLRALPELGNFIIKDTRTLTDYAKQTLQKHSTKLLIEAALKQCAGNQQLDLTSTLSKRFVRELKSL